MSKRPNLFILWNILKFRCQIRSKFLKFCEMIPGIRYYRILLKSRADIDSFLYFFVMKFKIYDPYSRKHVPILITVMVAKRLLQHQICVMSVRWQLTKKEIRSDLETTIVLMLTELELTILTCGIAAKIHNVAPEWRLFGYLWDLS